MASIHHLVCDANQIISQIIEKDRALEWERVRYHYAALRLGRVWRGYVVRKELRRLHAAATVIQKYVRRFLVQINMPDYMLAYLDYVNMRHYNQMATRIQAAWKGYWYRSRVLDFRNMYAEKLKIARVNSELRHRMAEEKRKAAEEERKRKEYESRELVLFYLFKLHHLLRTNREGVYSQHGSSEYSWIEKLLKSLRFTKYMRALRRVYKDTYDPPAERELQLKGRWRNCERAYYQRDRTKEPRDPPLPDPDVFEQPEPFWLNSRVQHQYMRTLQGGERFAPAIRQVVRALDSALNVSNANFDLTMRAADAHLPAQPPPYFIDFWSRVCEIHNIPPDT